MHFKTWVTTVKLEQYKTALNNHVCTVYCRPLSISIDQLSTYMFAWGSTMRLSVSLSSCHTLPVIVKDPTLGSSWASVFGTKWLLLLDLLQLLFLLHSPTFLSKSNNTDAACILHTCFLFRLVALNALHGLCIYCCDECVFGHFCLHVCVPSLYHSYIHHS